MLRIALLSVTLLMSVACGPPPQRAVRNAGPPSVMPPAAAGEADRIFGQFEHWCDVFGYRPNEHFGRQPITYLMGGRWDAKAGPYFTLSKAGANLKITVNLDFGIDGESLLLPHEGYESPWHRFSRKQRFRRSSGQFGTDSEGNLLGKDLQGQEFRCKRAVLK